VLYGHLERSGVLYGNHIYIVIFPIRRKAMRSTTKDLRYLDAKDKFLEYAFLAIGHHFDSRADFNRYFNSIDDDVRKSLFLRTASFYLFLVKRGDWIVDVPCSDRVVDYLTNTYKYVGIFSLIESLSDEKFIDFYQFLLRRKSEVQFPITDKDSLAQFYERYKSDYGSIKKCIAFFRALSPDRQDALISRLEVRGAEPSIEGLAKFLYELRSKFVHEAELVHHMTDGTSISFKGQNTIICKLSIGDALTFFEEGLIEHFMDKTQI
jgi:hypothetical protein